MKVLVQILRRNRLGVTEVCWTRHRQIKALARLLRANRECGELFSGGFTVVVGGRLICDSYSNPELQNAFWEGYKKPRSH